MAVTNITPTKMGIPDNLTELEFVTATAAADGFLVDFTEQDEKTLLVFANGAESAAATVTIKAGNGIQGVADLVLSVPAGETHAVVINSGEHKFVSGENKGNVLVIPSAATLTMGAIVLP